MKDKIKEIFRRMNDLIEHKFDKEYHTECDLFEDIQKLLDYITNLQEENKKLNDIIETLKETNHLLINQKHKLEYELDLLDSKRDKAIEYINDKWQKEKYYQNIENCMEFCEFDRDELLNILQGEDKDE